METGKKKDHREQVMPLAAASPSVVPVSVSGGDDEAAASTQWRSVQYLRKRRCTLWCCGCCGATVVILGIVILILSLTVFKVKDPTLTMNNISLARFSTALGDSIDNLLLFNATLIADISLKNPNIASFKFDNSTTEFYIAEETVGVAYVPAGRVKADRTARMNVTVDVLTDRVVRKMKVTPEMLDGEGTEVNMTSYTEMSGRVNVLGVYKRDIEVKLNCSMTLEMSTASQALKTNNCLADIK
ncbi:hypothetical protein Cni_G29319 [Canna indica]|uniref:Late embryogenesis abundant protein LEA-2 subgroup domain-containing protein n=1 Tax=Canna indica TaxID=4628 RepID=A0AAQ3L4X0_9LILI|nr:hypothetical protein Cni_G29319 [Canna indica]